MHLLMAANNYVKKNYCKINFSFGKDTYLKYNINEITKSHIIIFKFNKDEEDFICRFCGSCCKLCFLWQSV